jgi:DNA polymerase lambda
MPKTVLSLGSQISPKRKRMSDNSKRDISVLVRLPDISSGRIEIWKKKLGDVAILHSHYIAGAIAVIPIMKELSGDQRREEIVKFLGSQEAVITVTEEWLIDSSKEGKLLDTKDYKAPYQEKRIVKHISDIPLLRQSQLACQISGTSEVTTVYMYGSNSELADIFSELAKCIKVLDEDEQHREQGFKKNSEVLRRLNVELNEFNFNEVLKKLKGFGVSSMDVVKDFFKYGFSKRLKGLKESNEVRGISELTQIHGIATKTAKNFFQSGYTSLQLLREAVDKDSSLLNSNQTLGLKYLADIQQRIPRAEVREIALEVARCSREALAELGDPTFSSSSAELSLADGDDKIELGAGNRLWICGSYRRKKESSGDVDCLLEVANERHASSILARILDLLGDQPRMLERLSSGGFKDESRNDKGCSFMGILRLGESRVARRVDIKVYLSREVAYALLYFTGGSHYNRSMRHYCKTTLGLKVLIVPFYSSRSLTHTRSFILSLQADGSWDGGAREKLASCPKKKKNRSTQSGTASY